MQPSRPCNSLLQILEMLPEQELEVVAYSIAAEAFEVASKVGNWVTMVSKQATMASEVDKRVTRASEVDKPVVTGASKADMMAVVAFKVASSSLKDQVVMEYIVGEVSFLGLTEAIKYLEYQNQVEQAAAKLPLGLVANLVQLNYRVELSRELRD